MLAVVRVVAVLPVAVPRVPMAGVRGVRGVPWPVRERVPARVGVAGPEVPGMPSGRVAADAVHVHVAVVAAGVQVPAAVAMGVAAAVADRKSTRLNSSHT